VPTSKKLRDYIRALGNPYASLQIDETELNVSAAGAESVKQQFKHGENPHAWHYYFDEPAPPSFSAPDSIAVPTRPEGSLTQAEFEHRARAIFRPYIPVEERGKLRPHYREFIARNKSRSPRARYELIDGLKKYDISTIAGLSPQFNREQESLTKEKLTEIEKLVKDKD
jgi:hypothetical protein